MAKQFTNRQSVVALTNAIKAIVAGKSEEHCKQMAGRAVHTLLNSNSMIVVDDIDETIAALEEQLGGGQIAAPDLPQLLQLPAGQTSDTVDDMPF